MGYNPHTDNPGDSKNQRKKHTWRDTIGWPSACSIYDWRCALVTRHVPHWKAVFTRQEKYVQKYCASVLSFISHVTALKNIFHKSFFKFAINRLSDKNLENWFLVFVNLMKLEDENLLFSGHSVCTTPELQKCWSNPRIIAGKLYWWGSTPVGWRCLSTEIMYIWLVWYIYGLTCPQGPVNQWPPHGTVFLQGFSDLGFVISWQRWGSAEQWSRRWWTPSPHALEHCEYHEYIMNNNKSQHSFITWVWELQVHHKIADRRRLKPCSYIHHHTLTD